MERRHRIPSARSATAVVVALVPIAILPSPATAANTGRVTAGWPVPAPVNANLQVGSDGGPVALYENGRSGESLVAGWTQRGPLRWARVLGWQCGNCANTLPDASRPGGPFGPLAPFGSQFVAADGTLFRSHAIVLTDGTRFGTRATASGTALSAERDGLIRWVREDPFQADTFVFDDGFLVTDGRTIYRGSGDANGPTIALDPTNGQERWRLNAGKPVATFGAGVITQTVSGAMVGYDGNGAERFRIPSPPATDPRMRYLGQQAILVDEPRGRLYFNTLAGIVAYDTATSTPVWTMPGSRATSVTPTGTVLAAATIAGRPALRAISPAGAGLWRHETTLPVGSARSLGDGTIALTIGHSGATAGLLLRINPTAPPVKPTRDVVGLSRTTFGSTCDRARCLVSPLRGTMLRIASRSRTTMSVRVVGSSWRLLSVPAGVSFTPINVATGGTTRIQVRRGTNGPIVLDQRVRVTS